MFSLEGFIYLLIFIAIFFSIHFGVVFGFLKRESVMKNLMIEIMVLVVMIALTLSYRTLITLLKKYHLNRFNDIKHSLRFFFGFETFGLLISVLTHLIILIYEFDSKILNIDFVNQTINMNFFVWAFYPIF